MAWTVQHKILQHIASPGQTIATFNTTDRNIVGHMKVWESSRKLLRCSPMACISTAFLILPNFHLCLYNSIELRYMFSAWKIWPFEKFEPTTPNMLQHVTTWWPNTCNMLCPTMLWYFTLKCCDCLARLFWILLRLFKDRQMISHPFSSLDILQGFE